MSAFDSQGSVQPTRAGTAAPCVDAPRLPRDDPNALIDTKMAARRLGLRNHHTLEVWRSTQKQMTLRYHRVGRAIRYRVADLDAFLAANSVGLSPTVAAASIDVVRRGGGTQR